MERQSKSFFASSNVFLYSAFFTVVFIIAGIFITISLTKKTVRNLENDLLLRAQNTAFLLPKDDVLALTGTNFDLEKKEYNSLKNTLSVLHTINTDTRFFYLMRLDNEYLVFLVDSENSDSLDYSPPGQIYFETTKTQKDNFLSGIAHVEGPSTDRWGTWVTAFAPIVDENNQTIAMLGIDIDATEFLRVKWYVLVTGLLITFLIGLIFFLLTLYVRKSSRYVSLLTSANQDLTISKHQYEKMHSMMKLGSWRLIPSTGFMYWNDFLYEFLGIKKTGLRLTKDIFLAHITPEDRVRVAAEIMAVESGERDSCTIKTTVTKPDGKEYPVSIQVVSEKDTSGAILALNGSVKEEV